MNETTLSYDNRRWVLVLFRIFAWSNMAPSQDEVSERIKQRFDAEKCLISIIWSLNGIHSLSDIPKGITYNSPLKFRQMRLWSISLWNWNVSSLDSEKIVNLGNNWRRLNVDDDGSCLILVSAEFCGWIRLALAQPCSVHHLSSLPVLCVYFHVWQKIQVCYLDVSEEKPLNKFFTARYKPTSAFRISSLLKNSRDSRNSKEPNMSNERLAGSAWYPVVYSEFDSRHVELYGIIQTF
jgi:hypothetical protein